MTINKLRAEHSVVKGGIRADRSYDLLSVAGLVPENRANIEALEVPKHKEEFLNSFFDRTRGDAILRDNQRLQLIVEQLLLLHDRELLQEMLRMGFEPQCA